MTSEKRAQKYHTDDGSLPRHQHRISALVLQTSFRGEAIGGVAKFWLFSQARCLKYYYKLLNPGAPSSSSLHQEPLCNTSEQH